ncbi:MAG: hypothetical protein R3E79_37245 [Caldilineaceae bacterium]
MSERLTQWIDGQPETVLLEEARRRRRSIEYARQSECDLVVLSSPGKRPQWLECEQCGAR